ncbi:hypothetical protein AG1IA_06905 [Rhizoctonia solani AG-1 IA]|uniref:Uncharacterized protein n=1 Tax=Thanatephorus cucumeris (strain AG1-IA) TaxID=983506 RepID=L8WM85_THACA|nr:hypothetical protein AG1IA_06905 [Rhizoctonia solani AG-1 IA]
MRRLESRPWLCSSFSGPFPENIKGRSECDWLDLTRRSVLWLAGCHCEAQPPAHRNQFAPISNGYEYRSCSTLVCSSHFVYSPSPGYGYHLCAHHCDPRCITHRPDFARMGFTPTHDQRLYFKHHHYGVTDRQQRPWAAVKFETSPLIFSSPVTTPVKRAGYSCTVPPTSFKDQYTGPRASHLRGLNIHAYMPTWVSCRYGAEYKLAGGETPEPGSLTLEYSHLRAAEATTGYRGWGGKTMSPMISSSVGQTWPMIAS